MSDQVWAIVVTYNRKELLRQNLRALKSQSRPPEVVLVVNNASTDGTEAMLKSEFPWVRVLTLPENQGGAGGFHEGLKHAFEAGAEWFWLMDDDTFPEPDALLALLEAAQELKPRPAVLASTQLLPDGRPHPTTAFVTPTDVRRLGLWLRYRPAYRPIRWALFTSALLHRSVVEAEGLPHKAFFIWEDDLEYTGRILKTRFGFQVRKSRVVHRSASKPYVSATTGESRVYYGVRNRLWVLRGPAFGPLGKAFLFSQMLFGVLGFLLFHPSKKSFAEVARGVRDGLGPAPTR